MLANFIPENILLQGPPRVGKTTVIMQLMERLVAANVKLGGFYTLEIRSENRRVGFRLCDFEGRSAVIAHREFSTDVRVGQYSVDTRAIEKVALPALKRAALSDLMIIDEIARMELSSEALDSELRGIFSHPLPVVATIHAYRHPTTDALLARSDIEIIQVTEANRDALPTTLFERLT